MSSRIFAFGSVLLGGTVFGLAACSGSPAPDIDLGSDATTTADSATKDATVNVPDTGVSDAGAVDSGTPDVVATPTCQDLAKNGSETDIDCGGANCSVCADGKKCLASTDCQSSVCNNGVCAVAVCNDNAKNGSETDVDCGGGACSRCVDTKKCLVPGDCKSNLCMGNVCVGPQCTDRQKNVLETDVDCGGPDCGKCADSKKCVIANDCLSGVCTNNRCAVPTCNDNAANAAETDTDCGGGTCDKCADTKRCLAASDCKSSVCNAKKCAAPACNDTVKNGTETDIDCGGGTCGNCANGKKCLTVTDCQSGSCVNNTCVAALPSCTDGMKNGVETDVDCGGPLCSKCPDTKACNLPSDCVTGFCTSNVCGEPVINGCKASTAMDLTAAGGVQVDFGGALGNAYVPKCIKVSLGDQVKFVGSFSFHPLQGGTVVGAVQTPAVTGPFATLTNMGNNKNFTMNAIGTFPYYCVPHGTAGMNGVVFVVP
jgi:plastocyanin